MNTRSAVLACALALSSFALVGNASAQGKTRAEVRQELIEAQQNGQQFVTDASYPDVAPIYQAQVARAKQLREDSIGSGNAGTSASGHAAAVAMPGQTGGHHEGCVGPVSFCNVYFGN